MRVRRIVYALASLAALATIFSESLRDVLLNSAFQSTFGLTVPGDWLDFWGLKWLTVMVILFLALVNVRGVRWGGVLQLLITLVKVGSLLGIMALPFESPGVPPVDSAFSSR